MPKGSTRTKSCRGVRPRLGRKRSQTSWAMQVCGGILVSRVCWVQRDWTAEARLTCSSEKAEATRGGPAPPS